MRTRIKGIELSTAIYITALIVLIIPQLFIYGVNAPYMTLVLLVSTMFYIVLTRRWGVIQVIFSILLMAFSFMGMATIFVNIAGVDPSFILSTMLFGYFLVLLTSVSSRHPEWSIHSPWIGTSIAIAAAILVELVLLLVFKIKNPYIVGGIGLVIILAIGLSWLMFLPKSRIHEPNYVNDEIKKDFVDEISKDINKQGFNLIHDKKDVYIEDKVNKKNRYKLLFINDRLYFDSKKHLWTYWNATETKKAYSWVYANICKAMYSKKSTKLIVVENLDETETSYNIKPVKKPRSKSNLQLGIITTNEKYFDTGILYKLLVAMQIE